jgi:hypothetical protein
MFLKRRRVPTIRAKMKSIHERHEYMAQTLTNEIIDAAIEGFEAQKNRIDQQIAELRAMRDGQAATRSNSTPRKRKFSAEALRRMREAQQRRWAKVRGETAPSEAAPAKVPRKKRKLSAAGRRAIQEAVRKRWAAKRAEAAKSAPTTKKSATKKSAAKATKRAPTGKAKKTAPTAAHATSQAAGE